MFGESFAKVTKKAILGEVTKGIDIPDPKERYKSCYKDTHNETQNRRFCNNAYIH